MGFMKFRYFSGHAAFPFRAKDFSKLLKSLDEPIRRFIENHRSSFVL